MQMTKFYPYFVLQFTNNYAIIHLSVKQWELLNKYGSKEKLICMNMS